MSQFSHNVSIPFPDKERKYIFPFLGWRVIDFYVGKVIPSGWHTPFVCRESPNKKKTPHWARQTAKKLLKLSEGSPSPRIFIRTRQLCRLRRVEEVAPAIFPHVAARYWTREGGPYATTGAA